MEKCFYINYILVSVEKFYNNKNEKRKSNEGENEEKFYMYNLRYFKKIDSKLEIETFANDSD